jgi:hypothetical protein
MAQVGTDVFESKTYDEEDGKYVVSFDGEWTKTG